VEIGIAKVFVETALRIPVNRNWESAKNKQDGKYSKWVQLPAKAKFGGFVANTWQHLPHLLLEVYNVNNRPFTEFFDRYFHIP